MIDQIEKSLINLQKEGYFADIVMKYTGERFQANVDFIGDNKNNYTYVRFIPIPGSQELFIQTVVTKDEYFQCPFDSIESVSEYKP